MRRLCVRACRVARVVQSLLVIYPELSNGLLAQLRLAIRVKEKLLIEQDQFRIKMLTALRESPKWMPIRDYVSTKEQVEIVRAMKVWGWVSTTNRYRVRCIRITMEGRRILRLFEKMYREGRG